VPAETQQIEVDEEEYDEGDARTMSPRRSSEEVDRLEEGLRQNMIEYAPLNLVRCSFPLTRCQTIETAASKFVESCRSRGIRQG
jgi:hypothetical protein